MTAKAALPDQDQRDLIVSALDRNMLVEAGAGAGKTTSMVARMVALIESGKCKSPANMAAVTFTRKAAAELRGRFRLALESAASGDNKDGAGADGAGRERLLAALSDVDKCFVGTIHSFCARLLRERPVEGGVDLAFQELEDAEDRELRARAWDILVEELWANDPRGIMEKLRELGLRVGDLRDGFVTYCEYPDVEEWPRATPERDSEWMLDTARAMQSYIGRMLRLGPDLPDDPGGDKLIPSYKRLPRLARHRDLKERSRLAETFETMSAKPKRVLKEWSKTGAFTADDAREEHALYQAFHEERVVPFLREYREDRYGPALELFKEGRDIYDRLRRERTGLNFQDLLMKTADLLEENPHVRRYFSSRITHLLVDEFQDTDPIQAKVMLFLAADDPGEKEWTRCAPRPGSLFVVGDPKQSIYRFRRADIVTYNMVKDIIEKGDSRGNKGLLVSLTANFRTTGSMVDWVNRVFAPLPDEAGQDIRADAEAAGAKKSAKKGKKKAPGKSASSVAKSGEMLRFPARAADESPFCEPMHAGRVDGAGGDFKGVHQLVVPKGLGKKADNLAHEADHIARFIGHAAETGLTVPRSASETAKGKSAALRYDDFLIIAWNTKVLDIYAAALTELCIPNQVTGGTSLSESAELKLLHACLAAVLDPDDPVRLVGALRSELFGVSDAMLFEHHNGGGAFDYRADPPESLGASARSALLDAFKAMRRHAGWFKGLPAASALELMIEDLGLMPLAAAGAGGDVAAGSIAKALELLRSGANKAWSPAEMLERLAAIIAEEEKHDGLSVRGDEGPRVRVMNLHKAKGLEAPVVFLACPYGDTSHGANLHIDRSGDSVKGYMEIRGPQRQYDSPLLAIPPGWESMREIEDRFTAAEQLRLRYVAATRAGAAMVITRLEGSDSHSPWKYFAPYLGDAPLLPDPGPWTPRAAESFEIDAADFERFRAERGDALAAMTRASRETMAARDMAEELAARESKAGDSPGQLALPLDEVGKSEDGSGGDVASGAEYGADYGAEWGQVIHQLLRLAAERQARAEAKGAATPDRAGLERMARAVLAEHDLPEELADEAADTVIGVTSSPLWERVTAASKVLTEVPFQTAEKDDEGAPVAVRGVIDLAFREKDGWAIVDYKTDTISGDARAAAKKHAPQVRYYAEAFERIVGERVKETGIFLVRANALIKV